MTSQKETKPHLQSVSIHFQSPLHKAYIALAARVHGVTPSRFLRDSGLDRARRTLGEER